MSKEKGSDLITVVDMVLHRPYMGEGELVESRFSRAIKADEPVYQRPKYIVGEDWQELDFGWLNGNISMLVLSNEEGKFLDKNPTDEEQEDIDKRIVVVAYANTIDQGWIIPPKESFRGLPSNPKQLRVRCEHGSAKCTLTLFPS